MTKKTVVHVNITSAKKILNQRIAEVSRIRDQLRNDISELEHLMYNCESAQDGLQAAIDALSELA